MRKRITSLLLTLVMLLSLVPAMGVTALAASPTYVRVYNENKKLISLNDGECLTANDAGSATSYTSGSPYVARYASGTLYLKGYQGVAATDGMIFANGDLNIEVESNSSFTTSTTATNNLYGIQANGKLNISGSGKLAVTANGKGDVYGIYANDGVTISAPLDVQTSTTDNGTVYGIYTQSGAISLSGADKIITATGGNTQSAYGVYNAANTSTAITNNGNIDIRGKLTVNLINGDSNDGIRTDGGGTITLEGATVNIPSNFASGIYNQNGDVVIKNSSNVTLSSDTSYGIGIYARYGGNLTIADSTVTVSAKRLPASVDKGSLTIKDSIVDLTLDDASYRVVDTANDAANTIDLSGSGSVTLTASGKQTSAMIDGKVTATSGTKLEKGKHYPGLETYDGEYDTASDKTVLKFVHEDPAPATYTVSFDANGGTGTMAAATGISGSYTLPACTFTAPSDKQFKGWATSASGAVITGTSINVTENTTLYAIWEPIPVTTYSLTTQVNGGHGTISASKTGLAAGSTETVIFTPDAGYEIDTVTVNGTATSVSGNTLNVTMDADKTVVVTYKAIEYNITVTDGKATIGAGSGISKAAQGTTVTLTANVAPDGKVFDKWEVVSGGITLADVNSATTTFTMPASAVSVKATYKNTPVTTYSLTTQVNGGHGTISASKTGLAAGSTETITFTPDAGYEIDTVTVNGVATGVLSNVLDVTMDADKTVVVTYKAIEYNITVTDGKATIGAGSGISKAAQGTTVTLTANAAPDGKVFDKWVVESGSITLADVNSATTAFTMPASAVSVKATYKDAPHTHTFDQETVKDEALKSAADCTNDAVYYKSCACGEISTTETFTAADTALGHDWATDWSKDADNHWKECSRCHEKKDNAAHDYGEDNICDTCGHDKTVPHTHNLTLVPAKAPTCTEKGNTAYYTCDGCDKWFEDATGASEITDKTSVILAATGHSASDWKSDNTDHWKECTVVGCGVIIEGSKAAHTAGEWIIDTPATATTSGSKHKECTVCGYTMATETIPATGGGEHTHSYGSDWKNDADNHWHECSCGDKTDNAAHSFKWVVDKEATATKKGSKHEECKVCGYKKAAVEIPATGSTTKPSDPTQTNPSTGAESPKTGDNSNMILWIALLFVSGGAVIGITVYSKKKKENAE